MALSWPGGSGRGTLPGVETSPPGGQPLPRVLLELAASRAADFAAFDHLGAAQASSTSPRRATPCRASWPAAFPGPWPHASARCARWRTLTLTLTNPNPNPNPDPDPNPEL